MRIEASAPSNIALIKYMGKTRQESNLPSNASLSYTLEHLRSFVTIEESPQSRDVWEPLSGHEGLRLSPAGVEKYLAHFGRLKDAFGIEGHWLIRSANSFPSDCGLASSASSFAALTRAAAALAEQLHPDFRVDVAALSKLSRAGSGSSCRSFFSPWALWKSEGAESADIALRLEHAVILVEEGKKLVSSSEAHRRVSSSLLFSGRADRAEQRLAALMGALGDSSGWAEAFEICWAEFWDMHALFETSNPAFGYMEAGTLSVLRRLREVWRDEGDGPLVTMDAGANVHVLLRPDQVARAETWLAGMAALTSWSSSR